LQAILTALNKLQSIYGQYNIATADAYHYLGNIYRALNQQEQAEQSYLDGLKAASQFGSGDWLSEIMISSELASLYVSQENYPAALKVSEKTIDGLKLRISRHSGYRAQSLASEIKAQRKAFINYIDSLYTVMQKDAQPDQTQLINNTFKAAQIARDSSTANALSRIEQRFASGSDALAKVIRQRQDMIEKWLEIDGLLSDAMSVEENKRNRKNEQKLRSHAIQIKQELQQIDQRIKNDFPDYSNLTQSPPLSIKQVQSLLKADESLVLYLFGREKSFVWVVTKNQADLFPLPINNKKLIRSVRRLRRKLVPAGIADVTRIAPFPVKQSHQLFKTILQPAWHLIKDSRKLFLISDGALQSLPLSVLVTENSKLRIRKPAQHKKAAWLINNKALSNLPTVSALAILKQSKSVDEADKIFLGFGDPYLKVSAGKTVNSKQAMQSEPSRSGLRSILGNSRAAVGIEVLSTMSELPDSADELKQIAVLLKGEKKDVYLRRQATENQLNQINTNNYRVIQFATHGLMAGDFQGLLEPALVLTPQFSEDGSIKNLMDNGLLTASEVSQLYINADFVVLSACNTAASDGTPGAEGLSGLARSFLYAGGRTLLVTHWPVLSDAAVSMTTHIFDLMQNNPTLDIAGAHQQSSLHLMNNTEKSYYAHPMFWAPFMIVGAND